MSYAEAPGKTVARFIESPSWRENVDPKSLTSQLVSVSKETNRQPDVCYFEVENGILYDPDTGQPVLSSIKRETALQEIEHQVAVQIQDWAGKNDEGIAIWKSARFQDEYPCEKISIHTIAYKPDGKKVILNSYILFDAILEKPEELRKTIFIYEDSNETIFDILNWIKNVSQKPLNAVALNHQNTEQQATYFAAKIRSGIPSEVIVKEMRQGGFLGQNPISCPGGGTSFSNLLSSRSEGYIFANGEDQYGSLSFECPNCHSTNTRPFGHLISNCQHCGADVSC